MNVAIIPARGGSRRIPRKNIRMFHGKPIIAYSIEVAADCGLFDRVIVSTDDNSIADIARYHGALVHARGPELSKDDVGTQEVMQAVLPNFTDERGFSCCVYPCAPLLEVSALHRAHFLMVQLFAHYVVPVATWLSDPGQFYMGRSAAFMVGQPLLGPRTVLLPIEEERAIDINTPEDWDRAEAMYAALYPERVAA